MAISKPGSAHGRRVSWVVVVVVDSIGRGIVVVVCSVVVVVLRPPQPLNMAVPASNVRPSAAPTRVLIFVMSLVLDP